MDPPEVEARSDTREIPLATIDERSPSANYAGSQDTSSDNAHISARRSPVPPQTNTLILERTQRSSEAAQYVTPSSSLDIIPDNSNRTENISNSNISNNISTVPSSHATTPATNLHRSARSRQSRVIHTRLNQSAVSNVTNSTTTSLLTTISASIASIRNPALGLSLGLISLAIINATVPSITESMLDSIASTPISYSVAGIGGVLGVMLTQFQRILQSPSSERELTEDELFNRRLDAVMSILIIVGFTREEGIDFMENLHVFSLDHLVVVTTEVINGQLVELGIAECRHVHLRTGLETFSQHYTSHDNSSGNDATAVQNTFDVASYTPALHRRIAFTSPTRGDGMTITQPGSSFGATDLSPLEANQPQQPRTMFVDTNQPTIPTPPDPNNLYQSAKCCSRSRRRRRRRRR